MQLFGASGTGWLTAVQPGESAGWWIGWLWMEEERGKTGWWGGVGRCVQWVTGCNSEELWSEKGKKCFPGKSGFKGGLFAWRPELLAGTEWGSTNTSKPRYHTPTCKQWTIILLLQENKPWVPCWNGFNHVHRQQWSRLESHVVKMSGFHSMYYEQLVHGSMHGYGQMILPYSMSVFWEFSYYVRTI